MPKKILLVCILLLAASLRLYKLDSVPAGLHRDEVFLGYNAYSILKTGRDMTGNLLPIHLESFLWSPAGYSYTAIPFMAVFGLNALAVRLPSAAAGAATAYVLYLMAYEMFRISDEDTQTSGSDTKSNMQKAKSKNRYGLSAFYSRSAIALTSAFLLAITPWHINLSRTATENTVVVMLLVLGIWLFFRYLRKKQFGLFVASALLISATYVFYQAPRAFVPLIFPVLLGLYWKTIPVAHRVRTGILTALLVFLPVMWITISPTMSLRLRTVSIFASSQTQLALEETLREDGMAGMPVAVSRLFHNKVTAYTRAIAKNYFSHFSYDFLLTDAGLPDRYRVPGAGLFLPVVLPAALLGLLITLIYIPRAGVLLAAWILLTPAGSALTFDDVPNLQRTLAMVPPLAICAAIGFTAGYRKYKQYKMFTVVAVMVILWGGYSLTSYLYAYYVQQRFHRPWYRHEGYETLVYEVNRLLPAYSKAVITNHESSPSVFFMFYNRTDPAVIQNLWNENRNTDLNILPFGPYEFADHACPLRLTTPGPGVGSTELNGSAGILYVNYSECSVVHESVKPMGTIRRADTTDVFRLLTVTP